MSDELDLGQPVGMTAKEYQVINTRESVALALIRVGNIPVMDLVRRTEEISNFILYGTKKD